MLTVTENVSLTAANTLALQASARYFFELTDELQIPQALEFARSKNVPVLVLGGGSNIVLTANFPGLVIVNRLRGISVEAVGPENAGEDSVIVSAAAGENWHQLVEFCLQEGYYGLENLALIPGSVGAAPIQNIGAYGVELTRIFHSLRGWDRVEQSWKTLTADDCAFGYRDSIFKGALKGRFIISSVSLTLSLKPEVDTHYDALRLALEAQGWSKPTPQQVAQTVIAIRRSKLPDPADLPNAGSFFKNPVIPSAQAEQLKIDYPGLVSYPQPGSSTQVPQVKLAAGWLLERAGWKGKRQGAVGMHEQQSLVLINYAQANGADVLALATSIQRDIQKTFGIELEIEPALI